MTGAIRPAREGDLAAILELADAKRAQLARYQPVFWRPAPDGPARQEGFLRRQLGDGRTVALVHESDRTVDGFVIGALRPVPPALGSGLVCLVDDFAIRAPDDWSIAGAALLEGARAGAREKGAAELVVIAAHRDQPKRAALARAGLHLDSGWHVRADDSSRPPAAPSAGPAARPAAAPDAPAILALATAGRAPHQRYQPSLWRRAAATAAEQRAAVEALLAEADRLALVQAADGAIVGVALAAVVQPPPVYAPGGPVCLIEDVLVAAGTDRPAAAVRLIEATSAAGAERGAVLTIAICAEADAVGRALLAERGFGLASEWWVGEP